ncbi:MAG: hypothetical protein IBJ03_02275 [Gemmatimonadaceae bacterium]|nr:hypothetical protein [Gemmatimonadaceae bacterium]
MTHDPIAEDATLAAVLHRYSQRAERSELATEIGLGATVAVVALWLRPGSWVVWLAVGVGLTMLGTWAWADRAVDRTIAQTDSESGAAKLWRALRGTAALFGISAALVTAFAGVSRLLGTWIS